MTGLEDKEVVDELEDGELEESEDEDKIETKSIGNVHEKEFKPFSNFVVGVKESEVKVESRISSRNKYSENKASKNKLPSQTQKKKPEERNINKRKRSREEEEREEEEEYQRLTSYARKLQKDLENGSYIDEGEAEDNYVEFFDPSLRGYYEEGWKKGKVCKFFVEGSCSKGDLCTYSHDSPQLEGEICKLFLFSHCPYGSKCHYLHVSPNSKTHLGAKKRKRDDHYTRDIPSLLDLQIELPWEARGLRDEAEIIRILKMAADESVKKLGRNKENNRKRPLPFEPEIKSTKKPLEDISCNVSSKRSHPVRLSVSEGSVKQVSDVKVTFKTEDGDGLEDGETGELDEDDEEEDGEVRPEKEETIVKKEVETKKEEEVKEKIQKFVSKSETSISPVNKKDFSRNFNDIDMRFISQKKPLLGVKPNLDTSTSTSNIKIEENDNTNNKNDQNNNNNNNDQNNNNNKKFPLLCMPPRLAYNDKVIEMKEKLLKRYKNDDDDDGSDKRKSFNDNDQREFNDIRIVVNVSRNENPMYNEAGGEVVEGGSRFVVGSHATHVVSASSDFKHGDQEYYNDQDNVDNKYNSFDSKQKGILKLVPPNYPPSLQPPLHQLPPLHPPPAPQFLTTRPPNLSQNSQLTQQLSPQNPPLLPKPPHPGPLLVAPDHANQLRSSTSQPKNFTPNASQFMSHPNQPNQLLHNPNPFQRFLPNQNQVPPFLPNQNQPSTSILPKPSPPSQFLPNHPSLLGNFNPQNQLNSTNPLLRQPILIKNTLNNFIDILFNNNNQQRPLQQHIRNILQQNNQFALQNNIIRNNINNNTNNNNNNKDIKLLNSVEINRRLQHIFNNTLSGNNDLLGNKINSLLINNNNNNNLINKNNNLINNYNKNNLINNNNNNLINNNIINNLPNLNMNNNLPVSTNNNDNNNNNNNMNNNNNNNNMNNNNNNNNMNNNNNNNNMNNNNNNFLNFSSKTPHAMYNNNNNNDYLLNGLSLVRPNSYLNNNHINDISITIPNNNNNNNNVRSRNIVDNINNNSNIMNNYNNMNNINYNNFNNKNINSNRSNGLLPTPSGENFQITFKNHPVGNERVISNDASARGVSQVESYDNDTSKGVQNVCEGSEVPTDQPAQLEASTNENEEDYIIGGVNLRTLPEEHRDLLLKMIDLHRQQDHTKDSMDEIENLMRQASSETEPTKTADTSTDVKAGVQPQQVANTTSLAPCVLLSSSTTSLASSSLPSLSSKPRVLLPTPTIPPIDVATEEKMEMTQTDLEEGAVVVPSVEVPQTYTLTKANQVAFDCKLKGPYKLIACDIPPKTLPSFLPISSHDPRIQKLLQMAPTTVAATTSTPTTSATTTTTLTTTQLVNRDPRLYRRKKYGPGSKAAVSHSTSLAEASAKNNPLAVSIVEADNTTSGDIPIISTSGEGLGSLSDFLMRYSKVPLSELNLHTNDSDNSSNNTKLNDEGEVKLREVATSLDGEIFSSVSKLESGAPLDQNAIDVIQDKNNNISKHPLTFQSPLISPTSVNTYSFDKRPNFSKNNSRPNRWPKNRNKISDNLSTNNSINNNENDLDNNNELKGHFRSIDPTASPFC